MTIKITPEEIEAVARTVVGPAYDKVQAALADFRDTHDGASAFGGSAPGEHLAELHSNVRTVFVHTVHGVGEDLEAFKHNLTKAARSWDGTEQSNAERSQSLASHLVGTGPAATNQAYDHQRQKHREGLVVDPSLKKPESGGHDGHSHAHGGNGGGQGGNGGHGGSGGSGGMDGGAGVP